MLLLGSRSKPALRVCKLSGKQVETVLVQSSCLSDVTVEVIRQQKNATA